MSTRQIGCQIGSGREEQFRPVDGARRALREETPLVLQLIFFGGSP
jgi:hypothetical protein